MYACVLVCLVINICGSFEEVCLSHSPLTFVGCTRSLDSQLIRNKSIRPMEKCLLSALTCGYVFVHVVFNDCLLLSGRDVSHVGVQCFTVSWSIWLNHQITGDMVAPETKVIKTFRTICKNVTCVDQKLLRWERIRGS